ncbi:hypothetical protein [Nocardia africana]
MSVRCRACENGWCHRTIPLEAHDYIAELDVFPSDLIGASGEEKTRMEKALAMGEEFAKKVAAR